jgi:hypothetical protein
LRPIFITSFSLPFLSFIFFTFLSTFYFHLLINYPTLSYLHGCLRCFGSFFCYDLKIIVREIIRDYYYLFIIQLLLVYIYYQHCPLHPPTVSYLHGCLRCFVSFFWYELKIIVREIIIIIIYSITFGSSLLSTLPVASACFKLCNLFLSRVFH